MFKVKQYTKDMEKNEIKLIAIFNAEYITITGTTGEMQIHHDNNSVTAFPLEGYYIDYTIEEK